MGPGRPGWHIECSAMSHALLGEEFDIHGGGNDLQFPHHENEIAQSKCMGHGFAKVWMHNEMLQVEGKKMSKSLGNFFTVRDLLDQGVSGEGIRFVMLSTHYRKPMDWTNKKRVEAEKTLTKWRMQTADVTAGDVHPGVMDALKNDLNTHEAFQELHKLSQMGAFETLKASAQLLGLLTDELGGWTGAAQSDPGIAVLAERMFAARSLAMETKDFSEVDRLKAIAAEAGLEVRMSKTSVELVPQPGFDAAKLEALND